MDSKLVNLITKVRLPVFNHSLLFAPNIEDDGPGEDFVGDDDER